MPGKGWSPENFFEKRGTESIFLCPSQDWATSLADHCFSVTLNKKSAEKKWVGDLSDAG